jgi:ankyrin repeat protein
MTEERMNSLDEDLLEAARENIPSEVGRLLSDGADVKAVDLFGRTSLHMASSKGHVQVFRALREHGADIEAKDNFDDTPLHNAAMEGHLAVVNELLSPNDINGTTSILGKRKRQGPDIEAKVFGGCTPLHHASNHGHLAIVKALVIGGANIIASNYHGQLPVHNAVSLRRPEVAKYLLHELYARTRRLPLHKLLEDLTWIGSPNSRDYPPLRSALLQGVLGMDDVVEIVENLVGQNPELLSSRDRDGSLPLHVACRRGASFAIVQALVNLYKASVKSVTPQGDLPLFLACEMPKTSLDTIFLLMKLYPDLVYHRGL